MNQTWKVAAVQMDCVLGENRRNLDAMLSHLAAAARNGAKLAIFPECALTGSVFDARDEAFACAELIPGPATDAFAAMCQELNVFGVVGLLERAGEKLFNACTLIGPHGIVGSYRKIHLPFVGVDRFATPGDRPFEVWDIGGLRVGLNICYDGNFPESARVLALLGADLIALPTNWATGADCHSQHMIATRAMENTLYYAAANRVGEERGFRFIGGSRICGPAGDELAGAGAGETIIYAEIDPARARQKQLVRVPGKHEINRIRDRRPEFYGTLIKRPEDGSTSR